MPYRFVYFILVIFIYMQQLLLPRVNLKSVRMFPEIIYAPMEYMMQTKFPRSLKKLKGTHNSTVFGMTS